VIDAGELGTVTVSFSTQPMPPPPAGSVASGCKETYSGGKRLPCLAFAVTEKPFVVTLSFAAATVAVDQAVAMADTAERAIQKEISSVGAKVGGMEDVYDAMMTAIAWNVNYDPRVAVTVRCLPLLLPAVQLPRVPIDVASHNRCCVLCRVLLVGCSEEPSFDITSTCPSRRAEGMCARMGQAAAG
jgi:hypothetical protein